MLITLEEKMNPCVLFWGVKQVLIAMEIRVEVSQKVLMTMLGSLL